MAEKTMVEKAGEAVGFGIAMAEDVAGVVKTAVGGVITTVADAVKRKPAKKAPVKRVTPKPPAKKAPTAKVLDKPVTKTGRKRTTAVKPAKAVPAKKTPAKKAAKKAVKRIDKKTAQRKK